MPGRASVLLLLAGLVFAGLAGLSRLWTPAPAAPAAGPVDVPGIELSAGECEPYATDGSTHTGGGGALMRGVDLRELVRRSDRIVVGEVVGYRACVDGHRNFITRVSIRASEHWKLPSASRAQPKAVTVTLAGGRIGALTELAGGTPELTVGDQAVLFLDRRDGALRVTAEAQGAFSVAPSGRVERVSLSLDDFRARVRDALGGALPAGDDPLADVAGRIIEPAAASGEYALFPLKWFSMPVEYFVNPNDGIPGQLNAADVITAWTNAHNTWENDPGSGVDFTYMGATTRVSNGGCDDTEGYTSDLTWGIFGAHDPVALAVARTCFVEAGAIDQITEGDIEFDVDHYASVWSADATAPCGLEHDLETVTLHETGHSLGLAHAPTSQDCDDLDPCPIMDPVSTHILRTLCAGDQKGIAVHYPPPAPTPTATPKDEGGDTDGDTVVNSADPNDDNDGCTDVQETGLVATAGGLRDPHNFWDFFDTPNASNVRDESVAGTDFFALLSRFGSSGSPAIDPLSTPDPAPAYHTAYDRSSPPPGGDPWDSGPADGAIAGTDFFLMLAQFGHSCA